MVEKLAGLAAVALFAVPGFALTSFFASLRELPLPRRLGYGYLLGIAFVAGSLYALSNFFGVPLRAPAIFAVTALPLPGLLAFRAPARVAAASARGPRRPLAAAAAVAAAIAFVGIFAEAVTDPVKDWDGRMTWGAQARFIRSAGTVRAPVLEEERWFITHPRYPVLLPVAQAAAEEAVGTEENADLFRALYPFFFPAFLLILWDGATRWSGRNAAALTVLAACGLPFLTFERHGGAVSTFSDLPLACFCGAGLVLLLKGRARPLDGLPAGLLLGAAALTKNEGAILAVAALGAAALALLLGRRAARRTSRRPRQDRRWARLAIAAALVLLALLLLASWRSGIPDRHFVDYTGLSERLAEGSLGPQILARAPRILSAALNQMFRFELWTLFWVAAPLILLAGRRRLRRPISLPLLTLAAVPPAIGWAAYSVTSHVPVEGLVAATWSRMLVQGLMPFLLLLSLAVRDLVSFGVGAQLARARRPEEEARVLFR